MESELIFPARAAWQTFTAMRTVSDMAAVSALTALLGWNLFGRMAMQPWVGRI